jgi:hypothetical protein
MSPVEQISDYSVKLQIHKFKMEMQQNTTTNGTVHEQYRWKSVQKAYNTPTTVLACISVVLNVLIVVTFLKERKTNRKLSCGSVQLLILAVSDIAVSLLWAPGFVNRLLIENDVSSQNITVFDILTAYGWFTGSTNRFLMVYIAFTRARLVWSLRQAQMSLRKTERDHIRETVLYGVVPGALFGVAQVIIITYNGVDHENPPTQFLYDFLLFFTIRLCCTTLSNCANKDFRCGLAEYFVKYDSYDI